MANRREVMLGGALLAGTATLPAAPAAADTDRIAADLQCYAGFGTKAAGGAGDMATGAWLEGELAARGCTVERQAISVPWFTPQVARLAVGAVDAPVLPQPIVVPTGAAGVSGPLVAVDATAPVTSARGAIALVELPHRRWSSAAGKPVRAPVEAALAAGALAVVLVTNGPTDQAIALNCDGRAPMFERPVAVLAPAAAAPFRAAAARRARATLTVTGRGGRRSAFNLLGRRKRGIGKWLVISTPRSGWTVCAGERGGGVAVWLALARWAVAALPDRNLALLCNSAHEYENLGAAHALKQAMPRPAETGFWLHLGANLAARDWHEGMGSLLPLPSADPQRYLVVTPPLVASARRAFAGQPGLEAVYPSTQFSAGELGNILAAGYPAVAGVFGANRFHHVASDDARMIVVPPVVAAVESFKRLIRDALN